MDNLPLVEQIVRTCAEGLNVPVTCKIRMFPDLQRTIEYARMLERAGASLIAVHGRTREQKKSNGPDANWNVIRVRPAVPENAPLGMDHQATSSATAFLAHRAWIDGVPSLCRPCGRQ
jgi:tRNA-dihydrouridine synthase